MMSRRLLPPLLALAPACAPASPPGGPRPDVSALFPDPALSSAPADAPSHDPTKLTPPEAPSPRCATDEDCRYDPAGKRCGTDPRFNKQPPLVDQGIVCYCDKARACDVLRVDPAPCEGDTSCAVWMEPRPHPARADAEHPYRKPGSCRAPKAGESRRTDRYVTCERTNICTMFTRECAAP